jgi:2-polyprenyl-3-methyl-5-hydroxy-6-metoxy-1,4-benzoquinol methylase
MNQNYISRLQIEMERLSGLGWAGEPFKASNIEINSQSEDISFPAKLFEDCENRHDSLFNKHRARLILDLIEKEGIGLIWEIGAGDGQISENLIENGVSVVAVEPLISGAKKLESIGIHTYFGTLNRLNLPSNCLDAVGIFDVLEHVNEVEPFLKEIFRVLKPGGNLITTVPAGMYLFSNYDTNIGHYRRYTKKLLKKQIELSGFQTVDIKYTFLILVVPVLIVRRIPYILKLKQNSNKLHDKNNKQKNLINLFSPILQTVLNLERKIDPPIGFSIISSSRKKID